MAGSAVPIRVVATRSAFLFPVAGDYGGVDIKRHLPQRADFAEQPAAGFGLYPFVGQHIEAAKQSHDGLVALWPAARAAPNPRDLALLHIWRTLRQKGGTGLQ